MSSFTIPISREQFEAARAKLASEQNIVLTGDKGEVEGHKVGVGFSYDGATLTLTVEHKPWIYPESEVEKQIRSWFENI